MTGDHCPRCRSQLIRDGDEAWCLACGYRPTPPPAEPERRRNYAPGERNGNAKLTAAEVAAIRRLYTGGVAYGVLAARYGVSVRQVGNIVRRVAWDR